MPRPRKKRHINSMPQYDCFGPLGHRRVSDIVVMTIDEFESLRLIDEIGLNQTECALEMNIGRTTIQRIYNDARKKVAHCLVHGKTLHVKGGDYFIQSTSHGRGHGRNRQ